MEILFFCAHIFRTENRSFWDNAGAKLVPVFSLFFLFVIPEKGPKRVPKRVPFGTMLGVKVVTSDGPP